MSLQFVIGSSGIGKSYYIYDKIIKESMQNPDVNYILLVPEQYSMILQRKMVTMHPMGGTMNIDVIGFNRLAYRVFDELGIKPAKVLEDFGKSMLIRQVAGQLKDELTTYANSLDKNGFIDEVKSLMSELYQYDVTRERLDKVILSMENNTDSGSNILCNKLKDMVTIFKGFDEKCKEEYIVAEQIQEILANLIPDSGLIRKSVIVMDGFTGFTPLQFNVIKKLLVCAPKVYAVLTMDEVYYKKKSVKEHEIFYLTRQTIDSLKKIAKENLVLIDEDIVIDRMKNSSGGVIRNRWNSENPELMHLERNLFRYPYGKYTEKVENIHITEYDNPRKEIEGISGQIRKLVMEKGYRYKDIAVISGNLEDMATYYSRILPKYEIPYFLDYSRPVKNNPFIDAICHVLRVIEDNFTYDSMFAFLKSGVITDLDSTEVDELENYVLERGIRGIGRWKKIWSNEVEDTRQYVMNYILPLYEKIGNKKNKVSDYVGALREFMVDLEFEKKISEYQVEYAKYDVTWEKLYGMLFEKIEDIFTKMVEIMGEEKVDIHDFSALFELGLKDLSLGIVPTTLDSVIIGDITRTRLDGIKVLFIAGINDGIIPKKGISSQIISDREKDRLFEAGLMLAPSAKENSFIEQFYLYINMTKPSRELYLSYASMNNNNELMRPSYIIGRVNNIFPKLVIGKNVCPGILQTTKKVGIDKLIQGIQELLDGNTENINTTMSLYRLYSDNGEKQLLDYIYEAITYNNVPEKLSDDVKELIRLKLMSQSVSRLEQYANCAYAYFLKYTLGIRERNVNGIDNTNIGNILHMAMERTYRHVHDNLNNDWSKVSEDMRNELVGSFVCQAFDKEYEGQMIDEGRYEYLKGMLVRIGKRTAEMLCHITEADSLKPEYFEYKFTDSIKLSDNEEMLTIKGIVDRGDIYYSEGEGNVRLRVIDYKSGHHEFKINHLFEGLQLQLSVYMNIMSSLVCNQFKKTDENISVIPEGMYYYQMKDPFVEADNIDEADTKRSKELKLKGLVNDGSDFFLDVTKFAIKKSAQIANEILDGNIDKNPVVKDMGSACDYCDYQAICRFDSKYGGNKYHYLRFKDKDKDKVYDEIKKELGGV